MRLVFRLFEVKVKDKAVAKFLNELERLCQKYAQDKYYFEYEGEDD